MSAESTKELADFFRNTGPSPAKPETRQPKATTFFGKIFGTSSSEKRDKRTAIPAPTIQTTPLKNVQQFAPGMSLIQLPQQYDSISPIMARGADDNQRMSGFRAEHPTRSLNGTSQSVPSPAAASNRLSTISVTRERKPPRDRKKRQTVYASTGLSSAYNPQQEAPPRNSTNRFSRVIPTDFESDSIIASYGYTPSPQISTPQSFSFDRPVRDNAATLSSLAGAATANSDSNGNNNANDINDDDDAPRTSPKRSKYRKSKFPEQMRLMSTTATQPRLYTDKHAGGSASNDAILLDADLLKVMQELGGQEEEQASTGPTAKSNNGGSGGGRPVPNPRESSLFLNSAELQSLKELDFEKSIFSPESLAEPMPSGTAYGVIVNGGSLRKPDSPPRQRGQRVTFSGYDQIIMNDDQFSDESSPEDHDDNDSRIYSSVTASTSSTTATLSGMKAAFMDDDTASSPREDTDPTISSSTQADFESLAAEIRRMSPLGGGSGSDDDFTRNSGADSVPVAAARSGPAHVPRTSSPLRAEVDRAGASRKDLPRIPSSSRSSRIIPPQPQQSSTSSSAAASATTPASFMEEVKRALTNSPGIGGGSSTTTTATTMPPQDLPTSDDAPPPPPPHSTQPVQVRRSIKRRHVKIQARPVDYATVGTQCDPAEDRPGSQFDALTQELDNELATLSTARVAIGGGGGSGSSARERELESQLDEWKLRFEALSEQAYARLQTLAEEKQTLTLELHALRAQVAEDNIR